MTLQFAKTIIAVVIAVLVVVFALANRQSVDVNLWGAQVWSPPLGYLIIAVFLLGWLPTWLLHRFSKWNLGRRINRTEEQLQTERSLYRTPAATPEPSESLLPPGDTL